MWIGSFIAENLCSPPYSVALKMIFLWTVELSMFEACNYVEDTES